MRVRVRLHALALAGLIVIGGIAPAAALPSKVVFTGDTKVCAGTVAGKPAAPGCPGPKGGGSQGLYMPLTPGGPNDPVTGARTDFTNTDKWMNRFGKFIFDSDQCQYFNPLDTDFISNVPKPCEVHVQGDLEPGPGGIGATCGIVRGTNGTGYFKSPNGMHYDLEDVGWPISSGGVLPITGKWKLVDPGGGKKWPQGTEGPIVGAALAQGGSDCLKSLFTNKYGASDFRIVGVVVALPPWVPVPVQAARLTK